MAKTININKHKESNMTDGTVVNQNGKLVTTGQRQLSNMKRKFNAVNDKIANIAQEDEEITNKVKLIKGKKKDLTAKLDAELKELKTRKKQLIEERLIFLGERIARQQILEEFVKELTSNQPDEKVSIPELVQIGD
jgi:peptidoglycan hydrolase CwlO-like protein